jgi:hypothetical protein
MQTMTTDELVDVNAVASLINGRYEIKLVVAPPANLDAYAKVIEPIDDGRQLALWVPEGTPGTAAQNMATHFVPQLRHMSDPV